MSKKQEKIQFSISHMPQQDSTDEQTSIMCFLKNSSLKYQHTEQWSLFLLNKEDIDDIIEKLNTVKKVLASIKNEPV